MKKLAGLLLALLAAPAFSQTVVSADTVKISQAISRDELGVKSCGLNFVIGVVESEKKAALYDFSVNIWNFAQGMVKVGSHTYSNGKSKTRVPAPEAFWIAKRDDSAAIRPKNYTKAENAGFILGGADPLPAIQILMGVIEGAPLQFSMQYPGDRISQVVGFRSTMTSDERDAMHECLGALIKRMRIEGAPE